MYMYMYMYAHIIAASHIVHETYAHTQETAAARTPLHVRASAAAPKEHVQTLNKGRNKTSNSNKYNTTRKASSYISKYNT